MITFVLYLVHLEPSELDNIERLKGFYHKISVDECLALFVKSAKKVHPNCHIVVLTDESSSIHQDFVEVIHLPVDRSKIAYSRFKAHQMFLQSADSNSHYVFLDCDILIQKSLSPIFDGTFDIGLTYRTQRHPINGGVIFLDQHAVKKGIKFHENLITIMNIRKEKLHYWGGGQQALIDYFHLLHFISRKSDTIVKKGITFQFFPTETHNFVPDFSQGLKNFPDPYLIHFLDTRKEWMPLYLDKFILS